MQVESCSLFEHRQVSTEISRLQKNVQHVSSQENDVTSIRSYLIVTYGTGRVGLKKDPPYRSKYSTMSFRS